MVKTNRLLEDLFNLVVSVCAKFEGVPAKTIGGVGFLVKAYFCCRSAANSSLTTARTEIST